MSAHVVVCCDGHRHGQPCRGALHTRTEIPVLARAEAVDSGWDLGRPGIGDLCPSRGHDEEAAAVPTDTRRSER